jgi:UDP-N-acetylglucosamine--N-acetylmuramyl-(pentapeptide) pyrophosphoryl-undecaprenol N-acetylglucosamine transferase
MKAKRILLTGGGTAGHVTPNLALLPRLQALGFEIHYIGRKSGIERDLMTQAGIPYEGISAGKLRRYLDLRNVSDLALIALGFLQSLVRLGRWRPDVLFSKGGFVSCPVVWAAWLYRVPIVVHESDLTPGLANKLSAPFANRICYSFPETGEHLPKAKAVYTGIPIRETLLQGDAAEGRRICGLDAGPVVLISGGSQGAEVINRAVRSALGELLPTYAVCHLCGQGGVAPDLSQQSGYSQFEYVGPELAHLLAMADLVVTRAGATTLFELLELKKANLLVPLSRKASRGDQILNARSFEKQGFSRVLAEEDLTPASLVTAVANACQHRQAMVEAMRSAGTVDGLERVLSVIVECV